VVFESKSKPNNDYNMCKLSFVVKRSSSVSTISSSGMQQSTGHTAAHCGSS
jgi:hypothetical protein